MKKSIWAYRNQFTALISLLAIILSIALKFLIFPHQLMPQLPLLVALGLGCPLILIDLVQKTLKRELGADLLAGITIGTSLFLKEYLAGTIIVLMLSGGAVLETYALATASSVLKALAKRTPTKAHRRNGTTIEDVSLEEILIGDTLTIFPHESAPADGIVIEGHGTMDESYLTGEPFRISKAPGTAVLSGAVNGETALVMKTTKRPIDSRFAKIIEVVKTAEKNPPKLRRLGDQIGAIYAPFAILFALAAWFFSGSPERFLAVLVIATPCPLILAIPIAVIGSISLCARRSIIVKKPVSLEQIQSCRTIIFDKTGTLTYGRPKLTEQLTAKNIDANDLFKKVAALEQYSRHPLSQSILEAAREKNIPLLEAAEISEKPGEGLSGIINGQRIQIIGRKNILQNFPSLSDQLPLDASGLEAHVLVDNQYAATLRFRDEPRAEGIPFIAHLGPKHQFKRKIILSGDRESEAKYLAEKVGITEVYGGKSPEQKIAIVKEIMKEGKTIYVGDGINDAPALLAATVGIAFGLNSDITSEAAGAVILESSLGKIDEFLHISIRMRRIAIESAVIGMGLSLIGMGLASAGLLSPVQGAITQEVIDLLAILNALRASFLPKKLIDF